MSYLQRGGTGTAASTSQTEHLHATQVKPAARANRHVMGGVSFVMALKETERLAQLLPAARSLLEEAQAKAEFPFFGQRGGGGGESSDQLKLSHEAGNIYSEFKPG